MNKLLFWIRDFLYGDIHRFVADYSSGSILDVGGWDYFLTAKKYLREYTSYTCLDLPGAPLAPISHANFKRVEGDGCEMIFPDNHFDTVLSIQVLEHVFEPLLMLKEIRRVTRPRGYIVVCVPQTSNLHMAPFHYGNFTKFWLEQVATQNELEVVFIKSLGGFWQSRASRGFYFILQAFQLGGRHYPGSTRSMWFWLFFPLMILWSGISVFVSLIFSLFDIEEEAPNLIAVYRKL